MLKNILKLNGAQQMSKQQQQSISGGDAYCQGGCKGKNHGDSCYTSSGGCRSVSPGVCGNNGGLGFTCIPL